MNYRIHVSSRLRGFVAAMLLAGSTAFAVPTSTATLTVATTPTLRINEVLAFNTRIPKAGSFPDTIELFNSGATAIDLGGKSLSDDPALPRKFVFPNGTSIAAGGYLVVYADLASSAPGLHTGFALDAEGDQVRLYESTTAGGGLIDSIAFGFQAAEFSLSRTGSRGDVWALTTPTPGAANANPVSFGTSLTSLKINEWAGKISFRLDHDMIELFNPLTQPIALGAVRLTDDITRPTRFVFPALSFIGPGAFLPLFGADFGFGLDGDIDPIHLLGENNEQIDMVTFNSQPKDFSTGRLPDGSATISNFSVPTPGLSNQTPVPANHAALIANLRITELMYQPAASSNASDYEFIELQNIGTTLLDLSGVRFTNGLDYTFPAGTTLAPGAFIVVVKNRATFLSRYPNAASVLAPGQFTGALDNTGETLALTLPGPWYVHILRFRFEPNWYAAASGGGYSLVVPTPATTAAADWKEPSTWRQSGAVNGNPGAADAGTPVASANARLSNLSVRTALAPSERLIVGFFVDGGSRNILVRAAGPALTALGLGGAMTDPRLDLYSGPTTVLSNEDWPASLASVFTSVAAFAFPSGSRDAAFQQSVSGGVSVHARGTGAGIVLVEAYDTGSGNTPRMTNLSARNRVGAGDEILIAGFALSGTGTKRLLVRAAGPALTTLGVAGVLTDPKLELYNSSNLKVTENDNWSAELAATFSSVGAFPFPGGSRDSALIVTLEAGTTYTVQVRGADGGTGEGLVEIYDLP